MKWTFLSIFLLNSSIQIVTAQAKFKIVYAENFTLKDSDFRMEILGNDNLYKGILEKFDSYSQDSIQLYLKLKDDSAMYKMCALEYESKSDSMAKDSCQRRLDTIQRRLKTLNKSIPKIRKQFSLYPPDKLIFKQKMLQALQQIDPNICVDTISRNKYRGLQLDSSKLAECIKSINLKTESTRKQQSDSCIKAFKTDTAVMKELRRHITKSVRETKKQIDDLWCTTCKYFKWNDSSNTLKWEATFYTDFTGVENDHPNGLYQSEMLFKFPFINLTLTHSNGPGKFSMGLLRSFLLVPSISHLENIATKPEPGTDEARSILLYDTIKVTLDSSGATKDSVTSLNSVNSFDLVQWANLNLLLKVNVISLRWDHFSLYFEGDIGVLRTIVFDTLSNKRHTVSTLKYGGGCYFETYFRIGNPRFNARINYNLYWVQILSNDFQQVDGAIHIFDSAPTNINHYSTHDFNVMNDFSVRLSYLYNANKSDANAPDNYVFLRLGTIGQFPKIGARETRNENFRFQIGASFSISDLLKTPSSPFKSTDDN